MRYLFGKATAADNKSVRYYQGITQCGSHYYAKGAEAMNGSKSSLYN
jgi:hypothetical protein